MVKVAFSSDNHLDVNRVNIDQVLHAQAAFLNANHIDIYIHAGDLFNNWTKTKSYIQRLDNLILGHAYYIAGNHDMLNHVPYNEVENNQDPRYLHNRYLDLPGTNWRIVGNNGWYDYSFSEFTDKPDKVVRWKRVYWLDSSINQPISDQERMNLVLQQVNHQLTIAKEQNKRVIFVTHFAPRHELLAPKPVQVNTDRKNYFYQMINAMMGSNRLGTLLESFSNVEKVIYGHLHRCHNTITRNGVAYLHQAVGVRNKRSDEWQAPTFIDQWKRTIRVIDLK